MYYIKIEKKSLFTLIRHTLIKTMSKETIRFLVKPKYECLIESSEACTETSYFENACTCCHIDRMLKEGLTADSSSYHNLENRVQKIMEEFGSCNSEQELQELSTMNILRTLLLHKMMTIEKVNEQLYTVCKCKRIIKRDLSYVKKEHNINCPECNINFCSNCHEDSHVYKNEYEKSCEEISKMKTIYYSEFVQKLILAIKNDGKKYNLLTEKINKERLNYAITESFDSRVCPYSKMAYEMLGCEKHYKLIEETEIYQRRQDYNCLYNSVGKYTIEQWKEMYENGNEYCRSGPVSSTHCSQKLCGGHIEGGATMKNTGCGRTTTWKFWPKHKYNFDTIDLNQKISQSVLIKALSELSVVDCKSEKEICHYCYSENKLFFKCTNSKCQCRFMNICGKCISRKYSYDIGVKNIRIDAVVQDDPVKKHLDPIKKFSFETDLNTGKLRGIYDNKEFFIEFRYDYSNGNAFYLVDVETNCIIGKITQGVYGFEWHGLSDMPFIARLYPGLKMTLVIGYGFDKPNINYTATVTELFNYKNNSDLDQQLRKYECFDNNHIMDINGNRLDIFKSKLDMFVKIDAIIKITGFWRFNKLKKIARQKIFISRKAKYIQKWYKSIKFLRFIDYVISLKRKIDIFKKTFDKHKNKIYILWMITSMKRIFKNNPILYKICRRKIRDKIIRCLSCRKHFHKFAQKMDMCKDCYHNYKHKYCFECRKPFDRKSIEQKNCDDCIEKHETRKQVLRLAQESEQRGITMADRISSHKKCFCNNCCRKFRVLKKAQLPDHDTIGSYHFFDTCNKCS